MDDALPCCILAIDPGKSSGAALSRIGELVSYSAVDVAKPELEGVTRNALELALNAGLPLVLVGETWGKGGPMGLAQWMALGAAWNRWKWALQVAWQDQKDEHNNDRINWAPKITTIHVSTWRAATYGKRLEPGTYKSTAIEVVNKRHGIRLQPNQHDVAEAILINEHASTSDKVRKLLPKRLLARYNA